MESEIKEFYSRDFLISKERVNQSLKKKPWISAAVGFGHKLKTIATLKNNLGGFKKLDFIFWCSDETQWKNQFPVMRLLVKSGYNVGLLSNKKRILAIETPREILKAYLSTSHLLNSQLLLAQFTG